MIDIDSFIKNFNENDFMSIPVTPIEILKEFKQNYQFMEIICMKAQHKFCKSLENLESKVNGKKFKVDKWDKDNIPGIYSGGVTCVLEGDVFEKAGVNVSSIEGTLTSQSLKQMIHRLPQNFDTSLQLPYRAVGISCVIHPSNPYAPTMHFNFRFFQLIVDSNDSSQNIWWFGGGADLTPYYFFMEDATHFHKIFKESCDMFDPNYYYDFKKWCDKYFYISHRRIGGIFFDDLKTPSFEKCLKFVETCAYSISDAYIPIVEKRFNFPFNDKNKEWQLIRRGRGTKFGLCVPGSRIESILMSLPKHASWYYCHSPNPGTHEDQTLQILKNPQNYF